MPELIIKALGDVATAETDDPNGAFYLILSTPTEDRDGEQVLAEEWELPLPDHITFDIDHGMSVATTVGSGTPTLDDQGRLIVEGTYASTDLGQTTRALVNEGHIRTASVAFLRKVAAEKGGAKRVTRELLNGAFVAVPSNPEAQVLMSKSLETKEGKRNASADQEKIQSMHDTTADLGATCTAEKAIAFTPLFRGPATKAIVGSVEHLQARIADALSDSPLSRSRYPCIRGVIPSGDSGGTVVWSEYDWDSGDMQCYAATYTDDGTVATINDDASPVDIWEIVVPDADEVHDGSTAIGTASLPAAAAEAAATGEKAVTDAAETDDDLALRVQAMCLAAGVA